MLFSFDEKDALPGVKIPKNIFMILSLRFLKYPESYSILKYSEIFEISEISVGSTMNC